ncbi:universal stress protein [Amycolatopsis sp. NPDC059657]|uniref:universal stress protein n=1 Tax=Amycolatopsis sp. NPDC059657 TaxID=3346899 RepID=UPI00367298A4
MSIVVGIDGSEGARKAARWAALAAARHHTSVTLIHALGYPELYGGQVVPPPEGLKDDLRQRGWKLLREARTAAGSVPGVEVRTELRTDSAAPVLVDASEKAELVVVGESGHNRATAVLGYSVTTAVAAHAHCPVVSVRGDGWDRPSAKDLPVVVGVDGSPLSELAVATAFREADALGAELVAIHAWGTDNTVRVFGEAAYEFEWAPLAEGERRLLSERLAGWCEKYPDVTVRQVVAQDSPAHELAQWSRKAQLVVVGSRGRGGFTGLLLGSTSQSLIHHAACPVLIARQENPS